MKDWPVKTRSQARRLIQQGAVSLIFPWGEVYRCVPEDVSAWLTMEPGASFILKVGKKHFVNIVCPEENP